MMQHFLTIVVPVYNVRKYLCDCINSIISQSYSDFECILVDDGSTDGSGLICDEYAKKDGRIRVFHKENGGVSSARNVGLDNAEGEWVFFLDSDDLIPYEALHLLVSHMASDVDMVYGSIQKFDDVEACVETISVNQVGDVSIEDALNAFVVPQIRTGDWQRYLFNRLYRMSIIKEFSLRFFTDIHYKEDGLFVVQYLCRSKNKVACIPDIVYLYRQTTNSAMGSLATKFNEKLLTNIDSHGQIVRELERRGVSKVVLKRELREIFGNYEWITRIMRRSGVYNTENKRLLLKRVIKNAGPAKSFYYFVILRFRRMIKR